LADVLTRARVVTANRPAPAGPAPARRGRALAATVFRSSIAIVLLLVLWEVAPRIELGPDRPLVEPTLLPPFSDVAAAWWHLLGNGQLWAHTWQSLLRSLSGFGLAVLAGVPLGLVIAWYPRSRQLLDPLLEVFRNTAPLALLPVFTLILGLGETSKITLVLYACLFPVVLNTITGASTVDPLLIRAARSMGLPRPGCSPRWCCRRRCRASSPGSGRPGRARSWC
jgi:NitT/TauT family transport system permease protein